MLCDPSVTDFCLIKQNLEVKFVHYRNLQPIFSIDVMTHANMDFYPHLRHPTQNFLKILPKEFLSLPLSVSYGIFFFFENSPQMMISLSNEEVFYPF